MALSVLNAIAVRHVPFEDLGVLGPILTQVGWDVSYCDAASADLGDPALERADLLVVLGGPIGAYEEDKFPFLAREIELLERRLARDRPTLGICLGAQLMAKALGSRVFAGPTKEIGWGRVELTGPGRQSCLRHLVGTEVLHWHGDTFDLPKDAVRLARNGNYENQAFAFARKSLALQFHLEVEPHCLEQWYVGHAAELASAGVSIPALRAKRAAVADLLLQPSRTIFGEWLQQISAVRAPW